MPIPTPPLELAEAQRQRLDRFAVTESVDIHCHCLPALDDGPSSIEQSLDLCRELVADGITSVVATPHQLGRYEGRNEGPTIREAVDALRQKLAAEKIPLTIFAGADVRIDERIARLIEDQRVLKLGNGGYLLLELPHDTWIDPTSMLAELTQAGIRPIISHPERYPLVCQKPMIVDQWRRAGASLQLTSGSLTGDFGQTPQRAAWYWLETGQAALISSDAHNVTSRPPRMSAAIELIGRRLGEAVARRVCIENPARVLKGAALLEAVRAIEPLSW